MSRLTKLYTNAEESYIDLICFEDLDNYDVLYEVLDCGQYHGLIDAIYKLAEYENLGSVEDLKGIHQANQRCEKILETSLMVSQNNRLLSHELEVYKRALELAEHTIRRICPPIAFGGIVPEHFNDTKDSEYFINQARKELEDEKKVY